ncbi:PREDICTED: uncharacterized protein LOC102018114 isoform X2 [Chinchilla lanigera]|uniref:uncharacterized protein LOC102018114 isoform X2 n=1 Tax=Chinchilla lanigera TaxID=34839 RepID=UPI000695D1FD|nr:PREDICTED: uncharacterized protein LOC102018114 isoform X2 [Chinchilla lanigera]
MPLFPLGTSSLAGFGSHYIADLQYFPLRRKAATRVDEYDIEDTPIYGNLENIIPEQGFSVRRKGDSSFVCNLINISPKKTRHVVIGDSCYIYGLFGSCTFIHADGFHFSIANHNLFKSQDPIDEDCYEQMKARPERSVNDMLEVTPAAQVAAEAQMCYASLDHSFKGKRRKPRKQNTHSSDKDRDELLHVMDTNTAKTNLVESFSPESQAIEENIHDDPIRLFGLIRAKREPLN